MTAGIPELARHRMERARETLGDARLLLAERRFAAAVNRYYYAAFHAARALLATREADSARHAGVIALFQQHFVKSGRMPTDIARALPRAFEKRLNSDYEDFADTTAEEAERVARETEAFVGECARVLEEELSRPSA